MSRLSSEYTPTVDFSVLVSCYFEERSIDEFHARLSKTMQSLGRSYELIFVNDGSTDGTWERLKAIFERDRNVSAIVDFFKNSGQGNAKTPGVQLSKGKAIAIVDSDLQLDPEELPLLISKYEEGFDAVIGYRKKRQDPLFRTIPSALANVIMRKASGTKVKDFGCGMKLFNGRLVRALEFTPFKPWRVVPVISNAGRIAEVPLSHHPRQYGKSGYTFKALFAYNMENVVNLSQRPFQILAGLCCFLSVLFVGRIAIAFFLPFKFVPEVTTGFLLNAVIVGLLAIVAILAAVGEFVIRNFVRLQKKPAYVIRELLVKDDSSMESP